MVLYYLEIYWHVKVPYHNDSDISFKSHIYLRFGSFPQTCWCTATHCWMACHHFSFLCSPWTARFRIFQCLLPRKLACPLKINGWKMYFPIKIVPLKGKLVSFQGCTERRWTCGLSPAHGFFVRWKAMALPEGRLVPWKGALSVEKRWTKTLIGWVI